MQHLNERNVFTKTITIIQIMNEMCTWTNLVHRTNIGISPLHGCTLQWRHWRVLSTDMAAVLILLYCCENNFILQTPDSICVLQARVQGGGPKGPGPPP